MLIGIIGKTNTGKSTFFKAATLAEVEIENRPFVTIKPNHGVGYVKIRCIESNFNVKCNPKGGFCINGNRFIPIELIDVAGLIEGAHQGKGLGNQFLNDLIQADILIHIVDISGLTNEKGEIVSKGTYDPCNDIGFLEEEIDLWFLSILEKNWEKFTKQIKHENKDLKKEIAQKFSGLKINEDMVENVMKELNLTEINKEDLKSFALELRKISKPMIIAANKIDIKDSNENLKILKERFKDHIIIPCSSESELALREAAKNNLISYIPGDKDFQILNESKLSAEQKNGLKFIKENVLEKFNSTGLQDVLDKAVFSLLDYIAVYPVSNSKLEDSSKNILPDCFLIPKDTTALEFAFKIHTDIGDNFIKAIDLKTKKVIGKESLLNHRDVIEIVTKK